MPDNRSGYRSPDRKFSDLFAREPREPQSGFSGPRAVAEPKGPGPRWWAWILMMIIAVVALIVVFRAFVTSGPGQVLEHFGLEAARHNMDSLHDVSETILANLPTAVGVIAALSFLVLTVYRRRWLATLIALLSFGAANLTTQLLKNVILVRPYLDNGVPYYTGNSLPSGHTTFAAASFIAIFLLVAPRWRGLVAFWGTIAAVAVGVATYLEAWHRPADMVAAYIVAGFWGLVGGLIIFQTGAAWNRSNPMHRYPVARGSAGWAGVLWFFGIALLGIAAVAFLITGGPQSLPEQVTAEDGPSFWHLIYGMALVAGSGCTVFAVLTSFFRWESGRRVHPAPAAPVASQYRAY